MRAGGKPRKQLFITSKVPCCPAAFTKWCAWYASEYSEIDAYTRAEIDSRLLGVEYVDLMLLHWPCERFEDTLKAYRALEEYKLAGKARAIGISNFNASAIDALYASNLRVSPSINQCGFSIGNHNHTALGRDCACAHLEGRMYQPVARRVIRRPPRLSPPRRRRNSRQVPPKRYHLQRVQPARRTHERRRAHKPDRRLDWQSPRQVVCTGRSEVDHPAGDCACDREYKGFTPGVRPGHL